MKLVKNKPPSTTDLQDQASLWVVRLSSGQATQSDIEQFSLWLAQSDQHRTAFDDTLALWDDLSVVKHLPFDMATSAEPGQPSLKKTPALVWPSLLALAASFILVIVVLPFLHSSPEPQFYSTAIGKQQRIALDDGSFITLNTNSRIKVTLSEKQRSITLLSGEVFFEVAKDPQRPFIVDSCFSQTRALGTAFNIHCDATKDVLSVTHGLVKVSSIDPAATEATAKLVKPGQSISIDNTHAISGPHNTDNEHIANWRQGQLIFENTPLVQVIREINRYSTVVVRLGSPDLEQRRVTGRFGLDNTQTLLSALKHSLSLESTVEDDNSITLHCCTL